MPERFCNHRETSELFRLAREFSICDCTADHSDCTFAQINVQVPASVPRSADRYQEDVRMLSDLSAVISGPTRYPERVVE